MKVVFDVLLLLALVIVIVKDYLVVFYVVWLVRHGGTLVDLIQSEGENSKAALDFYRSARPLEERVLRGSNTAAKRCMFLFQSWSVVSIGSFVVLASTEIGTNWPVLPIVVAIGLTVCTCLQVGSAMLRRLVLGRHDAWQADAIAPDFQFSRRWSVSRETGPNLSLFLLALIVMVVLSFAALFATMPGDFSGGAQGHSVLDWVYFSVQTMATVGYGDILPLSDWAKVGVLVEISTGPLLLAWLLSVFLTTHPSAGTAA